MQVFYTTSVQTPLGTVPLSIVQGFRRNDTHTLLAHFFNGGYTTWCLIAKTSDTEKIADFNFDIMLGNILRSLPFKARLDDAARRVR